MKSIREFSASPQEAMRQALNALGTRYSSSNWDGEDAAPIEKATIAQAERFAQDIERLTSGMHLKAEVEFDITPEPDGHLAFGWYIDNDYVLDVSIGNDGFYYFASRIGKDHHSGKAPSRLGIPSDLASDIRLFYQ